MSYKLKIVAAGLHQIKEDFFKYSGTHFSYFSERSFYSVGVNIKVANIPLGNGEDVTYSIWDLSNANRFKFMHPTFLKGAAAYLLFFNVSISDSIVLFDYWLGKIKESRDHPLIVLISEQFNVGELDNIDIVQRIIEEHQIEESLILSLRSREERSQVLYRVAERIFVGRGIDSFFDLSERDKKLYGKFIQKFSICPVCNKANHKTYLDRIFFATDKKTQKMKENLLDLLEMGNELKNEYRNVIRFGIPCCECFNRILS